MSQNELLNELNVASLEALIALPGIGPVLAERIIAARPFASLEDAYAVKGINAKTLERLSATVTTPAQKPLAEGLSNLGEAVAEKSQAARETVAEKSEAARDAITEGLSNLGEAVAEKSQAARETVAEKSEAAREAITEGLSNLGEAVAEKSQAARQVVQAVPDKFEQASRARGMLWTVLVSNVITALVTILLTLLILGAINGSLKFATGAQYRSLLREAEQLAALVSTTQQDVDGLRSRVDTLEGLGERTVALEKIQQQLAADLETATQEVAEMQTQVDSLSAQIEVQEQRTSRFENFLKELQNLLIVLFAAEGVTP